MSKVAFDVNDSEQLQRCAPGATHLEHHSYPTTEKELGGGLKIRRALPLAKRRLIGPFCFLDHFGPLPLAPVDRGMDVAAHPHIGLQTVTWLVEGRILHRDSLDSEQLIAPGQLNVMTAGRGISHSEETPDQYEGMLHGVQLWVALPDASRDCEPAFEHHATLPVLDHDGLEVHLVTGEALGVTSPSTTYSEQVSMEILAPEAGSHRLALDERFEHGIVVLEGRFTNEDGEVIEIGTLYYMSPGHDAFHFKSEGPVRLFMVGGPQFGEEILMFWNFVGRTRDEIVQASEEWNAGDARFGEVGGYARGRLTAPEVGPIRPSHAG